MGGVDNLLVLGGNKWRRHYRVQCEPVLLEHRRDFWAGQVGYLRPAWMMIPIGLIVLGICRSVTFMVRGRVGHQYDDTFRFRPEGKSGRIGQRIELIFGNITAAARMNSVNPSYELVDVRGHFIAVVAVTVL